MRSLLLSSLEAQGFFAFGLLSPDQALKALDGASTGTEVRERYLPEHPGSVAVVALRYSDGLSGGEGVSPRLGTPLSGDRDTADPRTAAPSAMLSIGRFARSDWYGETVARLESAVDRTIAKSAEMGIELPGPRQWHRLSNSGLPERALAVMAGLGSLGRNGLLIARSSPRVFGSESPSTDTRRASGGSVSSAVVVGLLVIPLDLGGVQAQEPEDLCGACRRCIDACPSGALKLEEDERPRYERKSCIQHWTAERDEAPEHVLRAWGDRLYGCDECLEACPWFRPDPDAACARGFLGPQVPASFILDRDDGELGKALKGTALGRRWMSLAAFRRSAARAEARRRQGR